MDRVPKVMIESQSKDQSFKRESPYRFNVRTLLDWVDTPGLRAAHLLPRGIQLLENDPSRSRGEARRVSFRSQGDEERIGVDVLNPGPSVSLETLMCFSGG